MKKTKKASIFALLISILLFTVACTQQSRHSNANSSNDQTYSQISSQVWRIRNGKEIIYGHIYRPKNYREKKMRVAILSHGFGGTEDQMKPYAKNLAHRGYFTYVYDFPGGSLDGKSTGRKTTEMSIFTEEADLLKIIQAVRQRNDVQKNNILLVGASQGGAVTALTASRHPKHISALVLMYPAFSITDNAKSRYHSYTQVPNHPELFGIPLGKTYYKNLFKMDITKAATKFSGPVLIVHGEQDDIVPVRYARKANNNFKNSTLKVLPNAGHDFDGSDRKQAIEYMDQFINKLK